MTRRDLALALALFAALGLAESAQAQTPSLAWDHASPSTLTGFAVTIDGVRTDHKRAPVRSDGTCGCSIPVPFSGGQHTITVSAYNASGETASAPFTVKPTANAGGPYSGTAGSAVSVSAASSSAPTGSLTSYRWVWGDGSAATTASTSSASHVYTTAGTFTITLTVTDNAGATATATTTVTIGAGSSLPTGWTSRDIGAVGQAGSASHSGGLFTVRGAGADIWGTVDGFHYVYTALQGDGQVVARVRGLQNTHAYAKAGVMIRQTLDPSSAHGLVSLRPDGGIEFLARSTAGGSTTSVGVATQPAPAWVKLVRSGGTLTASVSADGSAWSTVGTTSVSLSGSVYVGLAVCSHVTSTINTATLDSVAVTAGSVAQPPSTPGSPSPASGATGVSTSPTLTWSAPGATSYDVRFGTSNPPSSTAQIVSTASHQPGPLTAGQTYYWQIVARNSAGAVTGPVWSFTTASGSTGGALPSGWLNADVGNVGRGGSATHSSGTFTLAGSGADVWGNADGFHYVYRSQAGDGQLVARMTGMQNTHQYAKTGLMLRGSLAGDAPHVMIAANPSGNVEFMTRASAGGSTRWIAGAMQSAPVWLKLVRAGSTVTGSVSRDGNTWTQVGSTTISLPSDVHAGLMVSSHDNSALNTAAFDSVAATSTGGSQPPPPPTSGGDVVIYASDVPSTGRRGTWQTASDSASPGGVKLTTSNTGVANTSSALASPRDYVDVTFTAEAGKAYRIWLRLRAVGDSKYNDSVWVQFSDSLVNGSPAYRINSTSGLLVNLATDGSGSSLARWGWTNSAYWLSQPTTVTFATGGSHTIRIQVREDGVELDQIVLSPATYLNQPPGSATGDSTVVPK